MSSESQSDGKTAEAAGRPVRDAVWTFRGYEMRPSEFNTAMVHFFRGEVQRANTWRNRLDATTNWAIISSGAAISFSLSDPAHHHGILLMNIFLVFIFLMIEARRYRYFELWSYRIRLLETDFFAAMLVPPFHPSPDWAETLADSLLRPRFPISQAEAIGRRFRRTYLAIFASLILVWFYKNYTQPRPVLGWEDFVANSSIGTIPGEWVIGVVLLFTVGMLLFGLATLNLQEASGEVLQHHRVLEGLRFGGQRPKPPTGPGTGMPAPRQAWQRPRSHREEFLTIIVSEKGREIAERVMHDLNRGVTALHGEGMFLQKPREVLMCALTETEVEPLKMAVRKVDPAGFVVVMPAAEIAGRGFMPLTGEDD